MHQPNHKTEDFFDVLDRPEGVVPKIKNFEAAPLTLGQKVARKIPSHHKDEKRKAGQEKGLALVIDTINDLIPKTKKQLGIDLALTAIPFGRVAQVAKGPIIHGTKLLKKKFGHAVKEVAKHRGGVKHSGIVDETAKLPTRYIQHGMQTNMRVFDITRKGGGPYRSYRDLPRLDVNVKTFKNPDIGNTKTMFVKDGKHEIQERVTKRRSVKEDVDVMHHTMSVRRRGSQGMKDDLASISFEARQADGVTYIEGIQMSSGIRDTGAGGVMGLTRLGIPKGASMAADKASIRLLSNVMARAPKNAVLVVDDTMRNTLTRDSLMALINMAGKYAKRILLDKNRRAFIKPKYEHTGSARKLDELGSEDFAEKIMASLEKASRKGKVHGTMDIRAATENPLYAATPEGHSISSLRIELAAAFGVPLSQFDDFMNEVADEKFEDKVLEQDAPIFE